MKILILVNSFRNDLWVYLTINSYYQIILKKITNDVSIVDKDLIQNYLNKNYIIITFTFIITDLNILNLLKKEKVILINADYYNHWNFENILNIINNEKLNITIFDYNPINMKEISKKYKNIIIEYIPLLYNSYLEEVYNSQENANVNYKDIDILFYGSINPRREKILEQLKNKYKIHTIYCNKTGGIPINELTNYIRRSKVILNIYYYEHNKVFDYYRNSYLLANKALVISEYPDSIDFNIEKNLVDIDKHLIMGKYGELVGLVSYYLDNYDNKIKNILEKQYKWFSNNKLDKLIELYFSKNKLLNNSLYTNELSKYIIEFKNTYIYLHDLNLVQKYHYDKISSINRNVTVTFVIPERLLRTKIFTLYNCWKNGYCLNNSKQKIPRNIVKIILKKV